jgi:hypothetical protein
MSSPAAATSVARLWRDQGKRAEARELLDSFVTEHEREE